MHGPINRFNDFTFNCRLIKQNYFSEKKEVSVSSPTLKTYCKEEYKYYSALPFFRPVYRPSWRIPNDKNIWRSKLIIVVIIYLFFSFGCMFVSRQIKKNSVYTSSAKSGEFKNRRKVMSPDVPWCPYDGEFINILYFFFYIFNMSVYFL